MKTAKEQFLMNWDEGDRTIPPTKMEKDLNNVIDETRKQSTKYYSDIITKNEQLMDFLKMLVYNRENPVPAWILLKAKNILKLINEH